MLSVHLKQADALKQKLKPEFIANEQAVIKAAETFSDALLTATNEDVSAAYLAERQIETELRTIERLLSSHANQTAQWTSLVDRLTGQLKELGDVSNWLQHLEQAAGEINALAGELTTVEGRRSHAKTEGPSS